jgi:hypothetical protein
MCRSVTRTSGRAKSAREIFINNIVACRPVAR